MNARDELWAWLGDASVSKDDLDAAIVAATPEHLRGAITPETDLAGLDTAHPVWIVLDAAFDALLPRIAGVLTDRDVIVRKLPGWTAGDLSRALDRGGERDVTDALAAVSVLAWSERIPEWDDNWDDALALGRHLRATIDTVVGVGIHDEPDIPENVQNAIRAALYQAMEIVARRSSLTADAAETETDKRLREVEQMRWGLLWMEEALVSAGVAAKRSGATWASIAEASGHQTASAARRYFQSGSPKARRTRERLERQRMSDSDTSQ